MRIENLTPYTLRVIGLPPIPPSGKVAKIRRIKENIGGLGGTPVFRIRTEVVGMPKVLDPDTVYVVSEEVKQKFPEHLNVMMLGDVVTDKDGHITGHEGLISQIW